MCGKKVQPGGNTTIINNNININNNNTNTNTNMVGGRGGGCRPCGPGGRGPGGNPAFAAGFAFAQAMTGQGGGCRPCGGGMPFGGGMRGGGATAVAFAQA